MRKILLILATCVLALAANCRQQQAPRPAATADFPSGDPIAGKKVFLDMRCWSCHEIYGQDMPKPTASPAMPVYLGGNAVAPPDELYVLRAIVAPAHELAEGWGTEGVVSGGGSRMGDYSQVMTARQLFDVIAFVRSRYGPSAEAAISLQK